MWTNLLHDYQRARILTLLDPESDPLGAGWNIIQSKIAIGSGGPTGRGFQQGSQTNYEFLPEAHTDFIFSVIGEEFGFLGTVLALSLFLFIILRCPARGHPGQQPVLQPHGRRRGPPRSPSTSSSTWA